jgi:hypothetical protein
MYHAWLTQAFADHHYSFMLTLAIHSIHTTSCISSGPYCNVLDLSLFPSMLHRHSAHLQLYNNTEASLDKIWKTVLDVWNDTSSVEVARAFILAYRVMRLITDYSRKWQQFMAFPRHPSLQCAKRLQRYRYRRSTQKWRILHLIFWFIVSYMLNHICTNTYIKPLG